MDIKNTRCFKTGNLFFGQNVKYVDVPLAKYLLERLGTQQMASKLGIPEIGAYSIQTLGTNGIASKYPAQILAISNDIKKLKREKFGT